VKLVCVIYLRALFRQVCHCSMLLLVGCVRILQSRHLLACTCKCIVGACCVIGRMSYCLCTPAYFQLHCIILLHAIPCSMIPHILIICPNIYLFLHLFCWLALYCCSLTDCSHKSHPDSGSGPSRGVVRISCAYSRFSNLIPFSPCGLRDPRVQVLGLEMKSLSFRYPIKSNNRRTDQANVPAMEHRHHRK